MDGHGRITWHMDTEIVRMRDAFAHIHAFIHFGSYHTHQIVRALPSCATGLHCTLLRKCSSITFVESGIRRSMMAQYAIRLCHTAANPPQSGG